MSKKSPSLYNRLRRDRHRDRGLHRSGGRRRDAALRRSLAALCTAILLTVPLAGCGESANVSDITGPTITIGIAYDRPGVALEHSGQMQGVDVDVAEYVAKRLGYSADQISWRQAGNADRDELLGTGDVNLIVGVHRSLDGDEDDVEFSNAYIRSSQDLMVRGTDAGSITKLSDLKGRNVCTVKGYVEPDVAEELEKAQAKTIEASDYAACVTELIAGTADAVEGDEFILAGFQQNLGSNVVLLGESLATADYGIALPKGSTTLRDFVNDALQRMVDDGSWAQSAAWNYRESDYTLQGAIEGSSDK